MKNILFSLFALLLCSCGSQVVAKQEVINLKPSGVDDTKALHDALVAAGKKDVKVVLEDATYYFKPTYAFNEYRAVTNHGNGMKNIIFNFAGYDKVEVEGNGAELIFHGQVMPFLFEGCSSAKVSDLSIDWDIPFLFQGKVVAINKKEGWRELDPMTKGYSWTLKNGEILFPNIDGFCFDNLGSTLPFEEDAKRVVFGGNDLTSDPVKVEKLKNGNLRIYEKLRHYPPVGSILNSKGDKAHNRYSPAFEFVKSDNVELNGVTVHHALGMGYLFERCDGIKILNTKIVLPENSDRVVSTIADATHFANCKGDILIENCRFENMLDDGTNVHGTYVVVEDIVDSKTVLVKLMHFEQLGFEFAEKGDEVWFVHAPSPDRGEVATVTGVRELNEVYTELSFDTELPAKLKVGDVLENKTWNPTYTMRGCTIRNHRARNIVLKTPLKTVIENNHFSSMMSAVLFRGETYFWYESGQVEDVLIRNNTFEYCAYSGSKHAVMTITPRLGETFDQTMLYDKNIRFENNKIKNFVTTLVWADRVDGLKITGNEFIQTDDLAPLHPDCALFEVINSKDVEISGNTYVGPHKNFFLVDDASKATLKVENNKGFELK